MDTCECCGKDRFCAPVDESDDESPLWCESCRDHCAEYYVPKQKQPPEGFDAWYKRMQKEHEDEEGDKPDNGIKNGTII